VLYHLLIRDQHRSSWNHWHRSTWSVGPDWKEASRELSPHRPSQEVDIPWGTESSGSCLGRVCTAYSWLRDHLFPEYDSIVQSEFRVIQTDTCGGDNDDERISIESSNEGSTPSQNNHGKHLHRIVSLRCRRYSTIARHVGLNQLVSCTCDLSFYWVAFFRCSRGRRSNRYSIGIITGTITSRPMFLGGNDEQEDKAIVSTNCTIIEPNWRQLSVSSYAIIISNKGFEPCYSCCNACDRACSQISCSNVPGTLWLPIKVIAESIENVMMPVVMQVITPMLTLSTIEPLIPYQFQCWIWLWANQ
jgi:hypothetical protein